MIEQSYGIIPLVLRDGEWQVLMILHQKGHWAFPKGRPMVGENPMETAARELHEETGLYVHRYFEAEPFEEKYQFERDDDIIYKKVSYYLAEVDGDIELLPEEVADCRWVPISEAAALATFPEAKHLCQNILKVL